MTNEPRNLDQTDALLLLELTANARLTGVELAQRLGISRNTVQARLARLEHEDFLSPIDRRVNHRALGYHFTAFVVATADQHRFAEIEEILGAIPEVIEVHVLSGAADLLIRIVAADQEDLYRAVEVLLQVPGILRTEMSLSIREGVPYRSAPLLARKAAEKRKGV